VKPKSHLIHAPFFLSHHIHTYTQSPIAAWSAFWARLAAEFKDNDFVLGYELINEPWAGDVFAHPQLLIPG